ncbi:Uma2 family endonuclease [Streptomyces sp. NPDC052496]|uniref:Uma2 family endonuclease n=1 Tax=Streptomyces sp. NPDC052496 TaxID=3154951 RepID=UPI00343023AB
MLAVEVVSPFTRTMDRRGKHGLYAAVGIASYWRVERGPDDRPVVHTFRLHPVSGVYAPSPERRTDTHQLVASVPFPVNIDLRSPIEV